MILLSSSSSTTVAPPRGTPNRGGTWQPCRSNALAARARDSIESTIQRILFMVLVTFVDVDVIHCGFGMLLFWPRSCDLVLARPLSKEKPWVRLYQRRKRRILFDVASIHISLGSTVVLSREKSAGIIDFLEVLVEPISNRRGGGASSGSILRKGCDQKLRVYQYGK